MPTPENMPSGQQHSLELQRAAIDATQTSASNNPNCASYTVMPYEEAWFAMPAADRYIPFASVSGSLLVPGVQAVISPIVGFHTSRVDGGTVYEPELIPVDQELFVRNVNKMTKDSYMEFIRFTAEKLHESQIDEQAGPISPIEKSRILTALAKSLHGKRNKVLLSTLADSDGLNDTSLLLLSDGQHNPAFAYPYIARDSRDQEYEMLVDVEEHLVEDDDHNQLPLGCVALVGSLVFVRPFAYPAVNRMNSTTPALRLSVLNAIEVAVPKAEERIMERTVENAIVTEADIEPISVFDWENDQTMRADILPIETVDKL